jgi:glucose/mannose-6-phosphate isomerase
MTDLDSPKLYQQYDTEDMQAHFHAMPQMCKQAWQMILDFNLPSDYMNVNKILILGMGGSAIGGDLAGNLVAHESKVQISICRDYVLPPFVDAQTLVIASSYSGMTEETLSSFTQALGTTAKNLVITTSGKLKTIAEKEKLPLFIFDYKAPPRAALPFSLLPILGLLQKLGFISDKSTDVSETVKVLQSLLSRINTGITLLNNPAKQLAQKLHGCLPVIYGADILSEVAHRWKTQLNENSKGWAFYEVLPELNHNAVVGYQLPRALAEKIIVISLSSDSFPERIQLRYRLTRQLLEQAKVNYQQVDSEGNSALSQIMSLVLFGDYTSYYLALLNRTNPTSVKAIDYLKKRLTKVYDNSQSNN